MKHHTQYYLIYIIALKWLEFKTIVICVKLRAKFRFYGVLNFYGTFSHKTVQILFVWHETWHTKIFGTYYFIEIVRNENNYHMLEITCEVAF